MRLKYLTTVFIFFITLRIYSQTDSLMVNNSQFIAVTTIVKNEYVHPDTLIKFYRIENGEVKYLLRHYKYKYSADCNNEFTTTGKYKVQNDSLLFLTEYHQKTGIDPIPVARKQIYKVDVNGKLISIYDKQQERSSDIWVETNYKDE